MRKKLLSLLLVLAMVLTLGSTAALADTEPSTLEDFLSGDLEGKIVILHTNDVHGALTGYAKIAAARDAIEEKGAKVLLVDDGDYIQGTAYVSLVKGQTAVDLMNLAGYDVATVGNHEFDYGFENLIHILAKAQYKTVAANVALNGQTAFDSYAIFEEGGVKIGVFGIVTPETATKANPAMIKGVSFAAGNEMFAAAQSAVDALMSQGCELIVCLGHLGVDAESEGNRSTDLLQKVNGIDLFIDGHSHTVIDGMKNEYQAYEPGGTMLVSTGTAFDNIGAVVYDPETKTLSSMLIDVTDDMPEDFAVAARANGIIAAVDAEFGKVFATTSVKLYGSKDSGVRQQETNMGDLIADAVLWKFQNDASLANLPMPVAALNNGGGIRVDIEAGAITKKDINTVLPFGNTLCLVTVTGAQLLEALEASTFCTPEMVGGFPQVAGIVFSINTTVPYAQGEAYPGSTYFAPASIGRVTIESVGGVPFDENALYTIATNNFVAAGGDTYYVFTEAQSMVDTGVTLDEVVIEYITTALNGAVGDQYKEPAGRIAVLTEAPAATDAPGATAAPVPTEAPVVKPAAPDNTLLFVLICVAALAALGAAAVLIVKSVRKNKKAGNE